MYRILDICPRTNSTHKGATMSLMKSSIPLTLYRLEPSTLANVTGDAIRRFAFRSIDNTPDEKGYGFVPEDDMFADLETSVLEKGQYMSFGFRIDTRKIPSAILKKHLAEMTRDELQRQGILCVLGWPCQGWLLMEPALILQQFLSKAWGLRSPLER